MSTAPDRARTWFWFGAVLSLLALHSEYSLPGAAWLGSIFLLRYARLRSLCGVGWVWVVTVAGWVGWLCLTALVASGTAVVAFLMLATFLTLPFLVDRIVAPWMVGRSEIAATLVFPAARAGCELLFTVVVGFGNFGSLADTQHENLALLQLAALTGTYGVSFVVAWLASVVNQVWETGLASRRAVIVYAAVLGLVLAGGEIRLRWFASDAETIRVAGISPSRAVDDDLVARTEVEARAGARIIVWSELAAHVTRDTRSVLIDRVAAIAQRHGVHVVLGLDVEGTPPRNQAVLVTPHGAVAWTYDKAHPTPPEAAAGLVAGAGTVALADTPSTRLATVICYDLDFAALVRQAGAADAGVLAVPANDWPGILTMHSEKAVVRAVENGVSILRPSSHGLATAIDPHGRVVATSAYYASEAQTVVAYLPARGVATLYRVVGDAFGWMCVVGVLALIAGVTAAGRARRTR